MGSEKIIRNVSREIHTNVFIANSGGRMEKIKQNSELSKTWSHSEYSSKIEPKGLTDDHIRTSVINSENSYNPSILL